MIFIFCNQWRRKMLIGALQKGAGHVGDQHEARGGELFPTLAVSCRGSGWGSGSVPRSSWRVHRCCGLSALRGRHFKCRQPSLILRVHSILNFHQNIKGAPAPGAPVVPTPLAMVLSLSSILTNIQLQLALDAPIAKQHIYLAIKFFIGRISSMFHLAT